MYDYFLGGSHNFAADRAAAERLKASVPWMEDAARANRFFLHHAVRFCVEEGVHHFLDLGSGIPTVANVHESARAVDPQARVTREQVAALFADTQLVEPGLVDATEWRPADLVGGQHRGFRAGVGRIG